MSDCSTHTMEPGERRTCGTCGHSISHWVPGKCVCMRGSDFVSIYENQREACSDWDKTDPFNIEQRCQHLEQVAREMLETIRGYVSENLRGADPLLEDAICEPYVNYRGKLEGCGVSVDD